jgi:hypothetical protein
MRTTIDIEAQLLKRLRAEAHRRGVSFKELLSGVIRRGLDERVPVKTTPYHCPTFAMGVPVESFNPDKALALAAALEDQEIARELTLRK